MSSMVKHLISASTLILPAMALASSQQMPKIEFHPGTGNGTNIPVAQSSVDPADAKTMVALNTWRMLNQSGHYSFATYAAFLMQYPDWPNNLAMRKNAELAIDLNNYSPSQTVAFFDRLPPVTNGGRAKYAIALQVSGDAPNAEIWARKAWHDGGLSDSDEAAILGIMASKFTAADHDARMAKLLWQKSTSTAERLLPYTSPARRAAFAARISMINRTPDAEEQYQALGPIAHSDPDILAERSMMLRAQGNGWMARELLANRGPLSHVPAAPEKWYEIMLLFAREAANDGQNDLAYRIASQVDDAVPVGENMVDQSLGVRDDYTSLTWLAGTLALEKLNRPLDAMAMFERYGNAARSPQTRTKGFYWAGLAAKRAGDIISEQNFFTQAGAYFDQFYGQLALEALGRKLPAAIASTPIPAQTSSGASPLYTAAKLAGQTGDHREQTLFLRTIANMATTEQEFVDAIVVSKNINRPDLAVMAGRNARVEGFDSIIAHGFPTIAVPSDHANNFTLIHAITRQESQFDRQAISHAGARGLMQLMPGTARETSGKIQMSYNRDNLTADPEYNIRLGSTYIGRMMTYYNGSYPLAIAAYNAGPGNVNKWLRANGDPRTGEIGILEWIERIPIYETKNYVQRVLENAVIYDLQNPDKAEIRSANPLSAYLGKSRPG